MKRPFGVTAVAVLLCIEAGLLALGCVAFFVLRAVAVPSGARSLSELSGKMGTIGGGVLFVFAAVYITLAIYMLKLIYWARPATIGFISAGLILAVIGILASLPRPGILVFVWSLFVIAVDVWILWYLTKPTVKDAFAGKHYATNV